MLQEIKGNVCSTGQDWDFCEYVLYFVQNGTHVFLVHVFQAFTRVVWALPMQHKSALTFASAYSFISSGLKKSEDRTEKKSLPQSWER